MAGHKMVRYDDEDRKLKFTFNSISDFETTTGFSIMDVANGRMGLSVIRALLWAGLKEDDEELTLNKTGEMLQKALESKKTTLTEIGKDISDALIASGILGAKKSKKDKTEGNA